ncbi:hypothetical protein HDU80_004297 [Chytriomyces hyalinus]|nr:hypothetical protein HDU80_004297 [Chytriomyces hyalinus]
MFLLKSLGTALWGSSGDAALLQLEGGSLHRITRRVSATRTDEATQMLFANAALTIRRTDVQYNCQLVSTRIFEEGEDEGDSLGSGADDDDDEFAFLIDEAILFIMPSEASFHWTDPIASTPACSVSYEYIIDTDVTRPAMINTFESMVYACMFERRNRRSHEQVSDKEMEAYVRFIQASAEASIESAAKKNAAAGASKPNSAAAKKKNAALLAAEDDGISVPGGLVTSVSTPDGKAKSVSSGKAPVREPTTPVAKSSVFAGEQKGKSRLGSAKKEEDVLKTPRQFPEPMSMGTTPLPINAPVSVPETSETLVQVPGDLFVYDSRFSQFSMIRENIVVQCVRTSRFEYLLVLTDATGPFMSQPLTSDMNGQFNAHDCCFVWLWRQEGQDDVYPWCVKFRGGASDESAFRNAYGASMYEALNRSEFQKLKEEDRGFLVNAYQEDVEMQDAEESEDDNEDQKSDYSDSEEEDNGRQGDTDMGNAPGDKNAKITSLTVGHKDRSYFVRGSAIGVLGHPDQDSLEYSTVINNVQSLTDKKSFTPSRVLLHDQDQSMLLMRPNENHIVYKMDLNVGKVVEEWKIDDVTPVTEIIPEAKNSSMTPSRTLVGINNNSIFRIDPRLADKLVRSESKSYVSNVGKFQCATTTGSGKLAVGSSKGDIRLYDKLSMRAKTHLPGLGDPILGIDTTESGKWVIATCKNYLLLVGTEANDAAKGAAFSGFNKSLGAQKPVPKRLQLRPEHVAWMGGSVAFTPAKFNTSLGGDGFEETSIVTSTGPFVITWNFKKAKIGKLNDYTIKQYRSDVVADNFKFGEDRNIIVALPENVHMISKSTLQTPAKMLKSRSSIVNSPY